jgi:hypothetical protein
VASFAIAAFGVDTLRTEKKINFHEEFANTIGSAAPHQNSHRRRARSSLLTVSTIDKNLADRARKAAYIGFGCSCLSIVCSTDCIRQLGTAAVLS